MPDTRWRLLDAADKHQVVRLEERCFKQPWTSAMVKNELLHSSCFCCGLEQPVPLVGPSGKTRTEADDPFLLVAYALFRVHSGLAELNRLAVSPEHRRRGLAASLLTRALPALTDRGAAEVFLEVRENNRAAIALYLEHGFRKAGLRENYFQDGCDALILRCALDPPCTLENRESRESGTVNPQNSKAKSSREQRNSV